jgi:ubiquinone/menaquinone biosynthesis C-methylase UbiE
MPESRRYNAEYYDAITTQTDDIRFYNDFLSPGKSVLELGCGTGRVSLALADKASRLVGVDISDEMISRAREKNTALNVEFIQGDISSIQLSEKFDLIIAPYRVMQALETDAQVAGLFSVIRRHLSSDGLAILNVFRPLYSKREMALNWRKEHETEFLRVTLSNGDLLISSDTRKQMDAEKQVLHPEIIHRRYRDGKPIDEHINPICMRYYYPDEFKELITSNGFKMTDSWGGYNGEIYGAGRELVVAFKLALA